MSGIPVVVEQGWTSEQDHGGGITSLHYPDGNIRIRHECACERRRTIVCAPALQLRGGHSVIQQDPLTVSPSIACDDCGLHGFITNGVWHSV